ncbi:hypothetical protein KJ836_01350 [Patescibacteria group bacterium]|nr:hypothetical protein [Patescibacteria group bacterium]
MPPTNKPYNYARDGFIYLLSYATLLISSLALNFLIKGIINQYLPDALDQMGFLSRNGDLIGFLAALLISFPIFLYVNILANKMLTNKKMVHNTGVRRWLIYLTLVVVILIIIWQLVALFITYLSGNLVARFLWHTLVTLLISGAVLGYQWWHLLFFDGKKKNIGGGFKLFEWLLAMVVVGALAWGFVIIDSPAVQRARRFDDMRVNSLLSLQDSIQIFYGFDENSGNHRLPVDLNELTSDPKVYLEKISLTDPTTNQPFEYRVIDETNYELCAVFETDGAITKNNMVATPRSIAPELAGFKGFEHGIGHTCFQLPVAVNPVSTVK